MSTKNVTARDILKTSQKEVEHKYSVNDNGEFKDAALADIFGSKLLEQGKLNKETAYEIRVGKGLLRRFDKRLPMVIKINIVSLDPKNQEIDRKVGFNYTVPKSHFYNESNSEESFEEIGLNRAKIWISKKREELIKQANINTIKENRKKLKEEIEK